MKSNLPPANLPRLQVNLSIVRGHHAEAMRHGLRARGYSAYAAIRDIPALVTEVERLWALACITQSRYADLRAAALACIAASEADEPDPLFYLRDELHAHQPPNSRGRL
jgi:hypothetical protein